jgi:hypothetical protein
MCVRVCVCVCVCVPDGVDHGTHDSAVCGGEDVFTILLSDDHDRTRLTHTAHTLYERGRERQRETVTERKETKRHGWSRFR